RCPSWPSSAACSRGCGPASTASSRGYSCTPSSTASRSRSCSSTRLEATRCARREAPLRESGGEAPRDADGRTAAGVQIRAGRRPGLVFFVFGFDLGLGEVLGRDVVEELLELLDHVLLVDVLALELDRGLLDHLVGREDRRLGAHGDGDRVGGTGVDLDL